MTSSKFEKDSYCVGGRLRSKAVIICGDITSKDSKVLIGSINRKKSMTVSDNTVRAEGLSKFF